MKTPDYVLDSDCEMVDEFWNKKTIPAGTFVKPIDFYYVPKHVREMPLNRYYDKDKETFCYCSYGIVLLPKNKIRRV